MNISKCTQERQTGEMVTLVMQPGNIYVLYLTTLIIIIFNYRLDSCIMVGHYRALAQHNSSLTLVLRVVLDDQLTLPYNCVKYRIYAF